MKPSHGCVGSSKLNSQIGSNHFQDNENRGVSRESRVHKNSVNRDSRVLLKNKTAVLNDLTNQHTPDFKSNDTMARRKQKAILAENQPKMSTTNSSRQTRSKTKTSVSVVGSCDRAGDSNDEALLQAHNEQVKEGLDIDKNESSESNSKTVAKIKGNLLALAHVTEETLCDRSSVDDNSSTNSDQSKVNNSSTTRITRSRLRITPVTTDESLPKDSVKTNTPKAKRIIPLPTDKNNLVLNSQNLEQSPARCTRSNKHKATPVSKTKLKPKAIKVSTSSTTKIQSTKTLDDWVTRSESATIGSPVIPSTRKSVRLTSQSNCTSPVKLRAKASPLKRLNKSPGAGNSKMKNEESKKVPVWKTKPKPELITSAPDDVYGFEFDPSDRKPVKKRKPRKPKNTDDDIFKPSNVKAVSRRIKQTRTNTVEIENSMGPNLIKADSLKNSKLIHSSAEQTLIVPAQSKTIVQNTMPLLKTVASKLADIVNSQHQGNITETPEIAIEQNISSPFPSPFQVEDLAESDTTQMKDLPEVDNLSTSHISDTLNEEGNEIQPAPNNSTEIMNEADAVLEDDLSTSHVLAAVVDEEETKTTNVTQAETDIDNCFGFGEDENSPVRKASVDVLIKSTPLKPKEQQPIVSGLFSSVSPVLKVTKSKRVPKTRPARLDEDVAAKLVRGIRPLQPLKEKRKQPTLQQFIHEVGDTEVEEPVKIPVPTPPSAFLQPPRRSYSKQELRRVKRTILHTDDDHESIASEEEEENNSKPKRRPGAKSTLKKGKRDAEAEEWFKQMNSHFEDVEKFNLSS